MAAHHRLREDAARWFMRMRHAEPDHPERSKFEAWLMRDPAHATEYSTIASLWDDFDSPAKLQSLASAMEHKKHEARDKLKRVAQGALGMLVAATAGLLGFNAWQDWIAQPTYQVASATEVGQIKYQTLDDGTKLVLNANTRLEAVYYRDRRTVRIDQGEVIFDVTKDPSRPFVVDSGHARVTVLGTRFAVNRLSELVRVSVDHGRVKVEAQDSTGKTVFTPILLQDGEVAEVGVGEMPKRIQRDAADAFTFKSGTLMFQRATLGEVAETLSRYRKPKIVTEIASPSSARITAVVQVLDIESFLLALPKIAPVRVREVEDGTRIERR